MSRTKAVLNNVFGIKKFLKDLQLIIRMATSNDDEESPLSPEQSSSQLKVEVTPVSPLVTPHKDMSVVSYLLPSLRNNDPKSHREYTIRVTNIAEADSNNNTHELGQSQVRFSHFHKRFSEHDFGYTYHQTNQLLPSKGFWWDDYATNEANVEYRASQMQAYLNRVFNKSGSGVFKSNLLKQALNLSSETDMHLKRAGELRLKEENSATERRMARIEEQKEAYRLEVKKMAEARREQEKLEHKRWMFAQTLNVTNPETRQSLRFPITRRFELHSKRFAMAGNETIYGHDGKPWFRLQRTDFPQLLPFSNMTYQLVTRNDVPLLEMKEYFRMFDYMCDLFYVASTGQKIRMTRVHRCWQISFLTETYDITGFGDGLAKDRFACVGQGMSGEICINGKNAASIQQHFLSVTDGYTVTIAPNQDCLLLLGIYCAISRIHAAIRATSSE